MHSRAASAGICLFHLNKQHSNSFVKLRCQRIGCDAMFTEDDNLDGSCQYHDSGVSTSLLIYFFTFYFFWTMFKYHFCN
ncbi:hypothetical protein P8452_04868 [Trifolium repens]|nr:hypothetical protein P8452_04868 [Trifolium repens]